MSRIIWSLGLFWLTAALVLLIIVSISLPFFTGVDLVRTHFATSRGTDISGSINQVRLGIWGYCVNSASTNDQNCIHAGRSYKVAFQAVNNVTKAIGPGSTRGLPAHVAAAAVTFIAWLCAFSTHVTVMLVSSLLCFIAAMITLIAFGIDIGLLVSAKHSMNDFQGHTKTGPGFWLTFVSFFLLLFAAFTVCFGRRHRRMDNANSYPMSSSRKPFWRRFRRGAY